MLFHSMPILTAKLLQVLETKTFLLAFMLLTLQAF